MYTALLLDSSCLSRYAARFDCGCRYELTVRLLSKDWICLEEFHPEPVDIEQWSDAKWREVSSSQGGRSFTAVLWHWCVASLTWPKVPVDFLCSSASSAL